MLVSFQTTGVPVHTVKRYQFNYETFPVPELEHFDQLKNMTLPILWFEELNEYDNSVVNLLKYQLLLYVTVTAIMNNQTFPSLTNQIAILPTAP